MSPSAFNSSTEVRQLPDALLVFSGLIHVRCSVASPLGQGERTKVRGPSATGVICLNKPSPSPSRFRREKRPHRAYLRIIRLKTQLTIEQHYQILEEP